MPIEDTITALVARCACGDTLLDAACLLVGDRAERTSLGLSAMNAWQQHLAQRHPFERDIDRPMTLFWRDAQNEVVAMKKWPETRAVPAPPPAEPTQPAVESQPPGALAVSKVPCLYVSQKGLMDLITERDHLAAQVTILRADCTRHEQEARDARAALRDSRALVEALEGMLVASGKMAD